MIRDTNRAPTGDALTDEEELDDAVTNAAFKRVEALQHLAALERAATPAGALVQLYTAAVAADDLYDCSSEADRRRASRAHEDIQRLLLSICSWIEGQTGAAWPELGERCLSPSLERDNATLARRLKDAGAFPPVPELRAAA